MSKRRVPALLRRNIRPRITAGGGVVQATGVDGFTSTGTGSYGDRNDSGASLQSATSMWVGAVVRVDTVSGVSGDIFSKGSGTSNGYRLLYNVSDVFRFLGQGINLAGSTTLVAGKTYVVIATRGASQAELYIWNNTTASALQDAQDLAISAAATNTLSAAIGAQRGDGVGGNEPDNLTIVGCGFGTAYLNSTQVTALMADCVAQGTFATGGPSEVSVWQLGTSFNDQVGTNHMTKVENTPGDLDADQTFTPDWWGS